MSKETRNTCTSAQDAATSASDKLQREIEKAMEDGVITEAEQREIDSKRALLDAANKAQAEAEATAAAAAAEAEVKSINKSKFIFNLQTATSSGGLQRRTKSPRM
jgi:dTDP-4-dehydrorhamnose reductase